MSERRFMFTKITVLLLLQNGLLAAMASTLSPGMSPAMMAMLAAGVILFSMTAAMMATRIAGSRDLHPAPSRISGPATEKPAAPPPMLPSRSSQSVSPLERQQPAPADNRITNIGDRERQKASDEALKALDAGLRRLATGDLSVRLDTPFADGFEGLRNDFNRSVDSLNESLTTIIFSAGTLHGECAEARLRLAQDRSLLPDEVPTLSLAGNGLRDVADLLREQDAALREMTDIAVNAKAHWQQYRATASKDGNISEGLGHAEKQVGEIAALTRDVAFRTNMLSVNASVAAANMASPQETLRVFASELRDMAETSAAAAKQASLLERDVDQCLKQARSQADYMARKEKHILESFEVSGDKLGAIAQACTISSDMVARTGVILDGALKYSSQRRALDHALETALERMSQELAVVNRHCGRFIQVTVLHDDQTPPDTRPPRHRSHLRLVKT